MEHFFLINCQKITNYSPYQKLVLRQGLINLPSVPSVLNFILIGQHCAYQETRKSQPSQFFRKIIDLGEAQGTEITDGNSSSLLNYSIAFLT